MHKEKQRVGVTAETEGARTEVDTEPARGPHQGREQEHQRVTGKELGLLNKVRTKLGPRSTHLKSAGNQQGPSCGSAN